MNYSNSTYSSFDDGYLEEYEIQTLTPPWGFAFEFATGVWLVLLCATFRPFVTFLRKQNQRRQRQRQHEETSGTCDNPCIGESCMVFIAMPEEEEEEEGAPEYDDDGGMTAECTETVGCTASNMETALTNLDLFEHKETFQMIQHVTEDRTREELVAIMNTSVLHVNPPTRRQGFLYGPHEDDIDADSDASVETSSGSDDDDNDDKFDVKYCLGYSWDELDKQNAIDYRNVSWTNLPWPVMRAARTLGLNRKLWDSGQAAPAIVSKAWQERDRQENAACSELGIDEEQWNREHDFVQFNNVDFPFRNWNELPRRAQLAAIYLGYDQEKWDRDENPTCGEIPWKNLSSEQREACRVLGFNQETWDGASSQRQQFDTVSSVRRNKGGSTLSTFLAICELLALDHETHRLVKLAIPATLVNILVPILQGTKVASIFIWMGPYQYLSWAIVNYVLDWCDSLTAGFAEAEKILCVNAISLKKYFLAGQYVQLTSLFHAMTAVTCYGIIVLFMGKILLMLDFGDSITLSAKEYIPLCATARLVRSSCVRGIEQLLVIEGKGKPVLVMEVTWRAFQLIGIMAAVVGFQSQSLLTIGILEVCSAIIHVFLACSLFSYGWLAKYDVGLFGNWALSNASLARGILKMTWPLTVGRFMVHGEWRVLTLFATYMGPMETIVWTLAQALWDVLKEFPTGMIIAAEVRIRGKLRVGRPELAKVVAYKSFLYIFLIAVVVDAVFLAIQEPLLALLTQDATLHEMVYHLVTLMCLGNVVLAIGSNAHSVLVTQHRAKTAALLYYLTIIGVTVPMATWLVVGRNYGLESLLMSCVFGYAFMTFCMLIFVFTTKWPKLRQEVLTRSRNHKGSTRVSKRRKPVPSSVPVSDSVKSTTK